MHFTVLSFRLPNTLILSVILSILHLGYCVRKVQRSVSDFGQGVSRLPGNNDDEQPVIEPISGSQNYRLNRMNAYILLENVYWHCIVGTKGKDDKPWFDGRDIRQCVRPGRCEKLKNSTCFGSKLPYQYTSLDLTDSLNQDESRERLYNYEALRNIPKCWAVIQVYFTFFIYLTITILV